MKEKIFTTEDGIDIYKGDKYFTVNLVEHDIPNKVRKLFKHKLPEKQSAGTIAGPYTNPKANEQTGTLKYFAKKENAEKFVEENFCNIFISLSYNKLKQSIYNFTNN